MAGRPLRSHAAVAEGHHGDFCMFQCQTAILQGIDHRTETLRRCDHGERIVFVFDVLRARLQSEFQGGVFIGIGRQANHAALIEQVATEPPVPRLPPCLLNAWRTSATARLRLSVITSTSTATPPGP